jgi:hypothetical protein
MPGLIRGVARTAAVVGTATVVSNGVSRRQMGRWQNQAQQQQAPPPPPQSQQPPPQYQQPVYEAPPPPPAAAPAPVAEAPAADDMTAKLAQLQQLGELKAQGILTDAEFDAQKSKILGG